jgi:hypothetical protein
MNITNCHKVGSHHKHRKHHYDNNTLDEKKKTTKTKLDSNRL